MFKRVLSLLLAAIILFGYAPLAGLVGIDLPSITDLLAQKAEAATEYTDGYYTYTVNSGSGETTITNVAVSASGEITVPQYLGGYPVLEVEAMAFCNCNRITDIIIPNSVRKANISLKNCNSLETLTLSLSTDYSTAGICNASEVTIDNQNMVCKWSSTDKTTTLYITDKATEKSIDAIPDSVIVTLDEIVLDENNGCFTLEEGVLYNSDKTTLMLYPFASENSSYVMPDTVIYTEKTNYDVLYYASNLKSITIGKSFYLGFSGETLEKALGDYRKTYNDLVEKYGETFADYFMPNVILQLGDGGSHTSLMPFSGNLEEIKVSPEHPYLTSKDGVLCMKSESHNVILVYPGSKKGTVTLEDDDICYPYAFIAWQEAHKLEITDGFCNTLKTIAGEYLHISNIDDEAVKTKCEGYLDELLCYANVSEFGVSISSELFSVDEYGALYNKNRTKLIKYPVGANHEIYIIPDSVNDCSGTWGIASTPLTMEIYHPQNTCIHVEKVEHIELGVLGLSQKVCTDLPEDTAFADEETGESVTLKEFFDEYNQELQEALEEFPAISEMNKTIYENTIEKYGDNEYTQACYEYQCMVYENVMNMLYPFCLFPKLAFCEGHETTSPEIPADMPAKDDSLIFEPSTTEITYGDSIVLHMDEAKIPDGGYVVWTADNGNFSYSISSDGLTCTISPEKSGDTVITATVYDAKGDTVLYDTQTMTSKAGFFNKVIAFFKKLFGLIKIIPYATFDV